jgi:hypothetical protein
MWISLSHLEGVSNIYGYLNKKKVKDHLLLVKCARENDEWTLALREADAASEVLLFLHV